MMMKRVFGFSLVEILIVLSLMGVMIRVLTVGYRDYNRRQTVTAVAQRLRQVFNEAKANAESKRMDCTVCGGANDTCDGVGDSIFLGWRVSVNANSYTIFGRCQSGMIIFSYMNRTENVPAGVSIIMASPPVTVDFFPDGGGTSMTVASALMRVSGWGFLQNVTIFRNGMVQ